MIFATIHSEEVETKKGTSKKGAPYSINEQTAMISFPSGEVRGFKLTLDDDALPLLKGKYAPKGSAFYVDGYDLKVSNRARDWAKA